jgi:protein TonB
MTAAVYTTFEPDYRGEARRWTMGAVIILLAHAAVIAPYVLFRQSSPGAQAEMPPIAIDFAPPEEEPPTPAPPVEEQKPEELAPPPPQVEAAIPPQPEAIPEAEPPPPPKPAELEQPRDKPIVAPPRAAEKPKNVPPAKKPPPPKAAHRAAASPATPNVGTPSVGSSASQADWHGILRAQLLRNKRYPSAAASNHETGSVVVSFTLDRSGRLLSRHIVRGSGHASLDEEALATIERSQPLPSPPADISPASLKITVPLNFTLR